MKAIYTGSYLLNQKRKREPGTVSETREAVPAKKPALGGCLRQDAEGPH